MKNTYIKKEILNKINQAKSVYVFNGFTEFYFKTTKSDLLSIFRKQYKTMDNDKTDTMHNYFNSWIEEFNGAISLNEDKEIFFN